MQGVGLCLEHPRDRARAHLVRIGVGLGLGLGLGQGLGLGLELGLGLGLGPREIGHVRTEPAAAPIHGTTSPDSVA